MPEIHEDAKRDEHPPTEAQGDDGGGGTKIGERAHNQKAGTSKVEGDDASGSTLTGKRVHRV